MRRFAAVLLMTMAVAAACASSAPSTTTGSSGASVTATLSDTKITLDQPSVPAGTITFTVANIGTVIHSVILLKTDVPHDKIPADPKDNSRVQETGLLKSTGQIPAGQSKQFSATLERGTYVILCNEPAHYLIGMHTPFTVK